MCTYREKSSYTEERGNVCYCVQACVKIIVKQHKPCKATEEKEINGLTHWHNLVDNLNTSNILSLYTKTKDLIRND